AARAKATSQPAGQPSTPATHVSAGALSRLRRSDTIRVGRLLVCLPGLAPRLSRTCTMTIRPRRSVLYMPGSNTRAIEKARTLPVDGIIIDLEDAVAPDAKETARAQAIAAVQAGGFGAREVFIRING